MKITKISKTSSTLFTSEQIPIGSLFAHESASDDYRLKLKQVGDTMHYYDFNFKCIAITSCINQAYIIYDTELLIKEPLLNGNPI